MIGFVRFAFACLIVSLSALNAAASDVVSEVQIAQEGAMKATVTSRESTSTKKFELNNDSNSELRGLKRHLALLSLATNQSEFLRHYEMLARSDGEQGLERPIEKLEIALTDIAQFWQAKGVKLKGEFKQRDQTIPEGEHTSNFTLNQNTLSVEPASRDYLAVASHIQQLLWLDSQYLWPVIKLNGLIRLGAKGAPLAEIAERLRLLGDLIVEPGLLNSYQPWLESAVINFQARHGLKPDGILGPQTLQWLNISPYERAKLLAASFVEKLTFQQTLSDRYLIVNIPAFELKLMSSGQEVLRSRVIVGKPYRQTPQLSSEISNLVINPSWRVPRKIIYRDLLPQVRKSGEYIAESQFDVFDGRGNKLERTSEQWQDMAKGKFPYRLVQKPGVQNALGRFKFHFANRYSVYLHDTPDKALFNQSNRALSSGCIRVESVGALANWMAANLVKDKQTWVELQNNMQKTQWFSLSQRLPVHLVYWTAWVDEHNLPQFRDDIYKLAKIAGIE